MCTVCYEWSRELEGRRLLPSRRYPPPQRMARAGGQRPDFKQPAAFRRRVFSSGVAASGHHFVCLVTQATKVQLPVGGGDHLGRLIPTRTKRLVLLALFQISERFPHQNVFVCHFSYILNY